MSKLSNDQIQFAQSMTPKQRCILGILASYPSGWFMSASERADPELRDLFRYQLVQCHHVCVDGGLPSWGVTKAGKRIADDQAKHDRTRRAGGG